MRFSIIMIRLCKRNIYKIWLTVLTSWLLYRRFMLPQAFCSSSFSFVLWFLHSTHSLTKSQLITIVSSVIGTIQWSRDTLRHSRHARCEFYYIGMEEQCRNTHFSQSYDLCSFRKSRNPVHAWLIATIYLWK